MTRVEITGASPQMTPKISVGDIVEYKDNDYLCSYVIDEGGVFMVYSAGIDTDMFCFLKQSMEGGSYLTQIISDKNEQQVALDLFHEKYEAGL